MGRSLESSRPIMAPSISSPSVLTTNTRANKRFSTFSDSPSLASDQTSTSSTNGDPRLQEIKSWTKRFDRLQNQRLQQQRYTPSAEKSESLSKLALGAKVERALGRRLTGQDATMRPRVLNEKSRSISTAI